MQSELKRTEFIIEFASGGQKNYAYRVITDEGEKTLCKVKGITKLSRLKIGEFRGNQGHDFGNVHTENKFKLKRREGGTVDIVTETETTRFRIYFFKRRRMHDHSSVPLGYI